MAGRKPTPKEGILSLIMSKIGLVPAKKKKKSRPKGARPQRAVPAYQTSYGDEPPQAEGFDEAVHYAAAAAAGYAPVPSPLMEPLFPAGGPALPHFGEDAPPEEDPWLASAPTPLSMPEPAMEPPGVPAWASVPEPQPQSQLQSQPGAFDLPLEAAADGKLFSGDGLDNSLDDLFAGLEMGHAPMGAYAPGPADSSPTWPAGGTTTVAAPVATVVSEPIVAHTEPIVTPPEPIRPSAPPVNTQAAREPAVHSAIPGVLTFNSQDLRSLLRALERVSGVAGSLLVGYDGLLIASTALPDEWDGDYVGAQASSLFGNSYEQLEKMRHGELRRLTLESEGGLMVMTAADMGILVVISEYGQTMDTAAVSAAIAGAVGRS